MDSIVHNRNITDLTAKVSGLDKILDKTVSYDPELGISYIDYSKNTYWHNGYEYKDAWYPLWDSADALQVVIALGMTVQVGRTDVHVVCGAESVTLPLGIDPESVVRRAIVTAAAQLAVSQGIKSSIQS